jgi:hypothetical protein
VRIVEQIRAHWPRAQLILCADSGFARDTIMTWCERHHVDYVFGLARNALLESMLHTEMKIVRTIHRRTGEAARLFRELRYETLDSWSRSRRVVGKAEQLPGKSNPRFVVTSLKLSDFDTRELYEQLYCARGDMESDSRTTPARTCRHPVAQRPSRYHPNSPTEDRSCGHAERAARGSLAYRERTAAQTHPT